MEKSIILFHSENGQNYSVYLISLLNINSIDSVNVSADYLEIRYLLNHKKNASAYSRKN